MLHCNNKYVMPVPNETYRKNFPKVKQDRVKVVLTEVQARTFEAVGYDPDDKQLVIRDRRGIEWHFYNVPRAIWEEFLTTPHSDDFFNLVLKRDFACMRCRGAAHTHGL